ncbi:hypothetical protein J6590_036189 [Homalodisca vitripennis]|nr:hypothetical protein J6590_036189 [Homalodisca vitripennis]
MWSGCTGLDHNDVFVQDYTVHSWHHEEEQLCVRDAPAWTIMSCLCNSAPSTHDIMRKNSYVVGMHRPGPQRRYPPSTHDIMRKNSYVFGMHRPGPQCRVCATLHRVLTTS